MIYNDEIEKFFKEQVGIELKNDKAYLFLQKHTTECAWIGKVNFNSYSVFMNKAEVLEKIKNWDAYFISEERDDFPFWIGDELNFTYNGIKGILEEMKDNFIEIPLETAIFLKERLAGDNLQVF